MKPSFYLSRSAFAGIVLYLAASCGGSADPQPKLSQNGDGLQPNPYFGQSVRTPYEAVAKDQLLARHIEKLRSGSREGLRFAKQVIGDYGEKAVPALVEGLRVELDQGSAAAANFLSALSYTKTQQTLPILLEVLENHPLPLVRSQAIDTIGILKQTELLAGLLEHAQRETESGPMTRLMPCLCSLGGKEAAAYLAGLVQLWADGSPFHLNGTNAWDSLLLIEGDVALAKIASLLDAVPPLLRHAGWIRLYEGGQEQWKAQALSLLDHETLPNATLRRRLVAALATDGDLDSVMLASLDPDFTVRVAVIEALRLSEEPLSEAAHAHLIKVASSPNKDSAYPALRALLERGEGVHLEPWLAQVKGYPTRAGSIDALHLFLQEGIQHPRLIPMLIERWPYCEADFRIDITRVMAKHPSPQAIEFLQKIVSDPEEDPDVRLYGINSLGNSGEMSIPALFEVWKMDPSPTATDKLFSALLRFADDPRVRDFCFELVVDPNASDHAKAWMLARLPNAYREQAYQPLLDAKEATEREEIRLYIDGILHEFF